jgi:hypothetical protein
MVAPSDAVEADASTETLRPETELVNDATGA